MEKMKRRKNTTMRKTTTGYAMALISLSAAVRAGRQSSANIQVSKDGRHLTPTKTLTSVKCVSVGVFTAKASVFLLASLENQIQYHLMMMRPTTESLTLQIAVDE